METTEPQTLTVDFSEHILTVTLNRPSKLNSFDTVMRAELSELWASTNDLAGLRCIVITGSGRAFCTGADVSAMNEDRGGAPTVGEELGYLPRHVPVPVITAVNGICAGGGLHFLAEADFAIAAENATFVDPHVSVGQVSGLEPISLMLRMGEQALTRMVLLGSRERIPAVDALRVGLVTEVVPADVLDARARELAAMVATNSPSAVARSLVAIRTLRRRLIEGDMDLAWTSIQDQWTHPDAVEGPRAFGEKRPPRWADR